MATKFKPKSPAPQKPVNGCSLRQVKKRAVENKKSLLLQTTLQTNNKTFDTLQVPTIDFSKLLNPEYPYKSQLRSSKLFVQQSSGEKMFGPFTKSRQKSREKLKTGSTSDDTDQSRHMNGEKEMKPRQSKSWKKIDGKLQKLESSVSIRTVSSNFLESFRFVLKELMENYFTGVALKNKVSHLRIEIWNYILKKAGIQIGGEKRKLLYNQIEKRAFISGLENIYKEVFRGSQVEVMVAKYFTYDSIVFFSQLEDILDLDKGVVDEKIMDVYEGKFSGMGTSQMVRMLLKTLIEYADLEKKLQLICSANEYEVLKFLSSMNEGSALELDRLTKFLEEGDESSEQSGKESGNQSCKQTVQMGKRMGSRKVGIFLERVLKKLTKLEMIKWLKVHDKVDKILG